jgi:hypothetical protein
MAGFRHVNDGQAAMDEERLGNDLLFHASTLTASSAVERDPPLVIRATMSQILKEAFQPLSLDRAGRRESKTTYSTHCSSIHFSHIAQPISSKIRDFT